MANLSQTRESIQGNWAYVIEVELDDCTVTVGSGQCETKNRKLKMKKKAHHFDDAVAAALYFRYELSKLEERGYGLVDGDEVELDPNEDYKKVKFKTSNYRYYENAETKKFWDIDRDYSELTMWEGEIDTRGERSLIVCDWDGDAKERYAELVSAKEGEGYVLGGEPIAHPFLHDNSEIELADSLKSFYEKGDYKKYQHHILGDIEYSEGLHVDFDVIDALMNPDFTEEMLGEGYVEFANLIYDLETDPEGHECYAHLAIHPQTTKVYLMEPSGDPELIADTLQGFLARLKPAG